MVVTYDEALTTIHRLEGRPWRAGLDRMREFVERAGLASALAERNYIHVAGTNGKGTTTAFVESILRAQGWRTGAFFSPYVVDYRERVQANGAMIGPHELADLVERLMPAADSMVDSSFGGVTKFELEAALGFAYWQQKACEWVALEVGLGGRLDATNVVEPRACIVTSIGLDHTSILGHTLEEIAAEKAGIIKPHVPVVVGEMPTAERDVIVQIARQREAPLWRIGKEVTIWPNQGTWTVQLPGASIGGLRPTLGGDRTPHNMALAVAALFAAGAIQDSGEALSNGVRDAWLPGRFERRTVEGREVILDGAHNAEAAVVLLNSIGERPLRLVTGMISGHETEAFYRVFKSVAIGAEVAPIDSPRAMKTETAVAKIAALGIPAREHASVADALRTALAENDATILVTGSNYLVGDALRLLA